MTRAELANLLFPQITTTIPELLTKYPHRPQPVCDRIAPSPTGYFHFGNLYTAILNWKFAQQNHGVFYLRVEDTDQARKIDDAVDVVINALKKFGISIDEGPIGENNTEIGEYGPYFQSSRKEIYLTFIKHLITEGLAYPCWMTPEELDQIRTNQTEKKLIPGIYGEFSKYRAYTPDQLAQKYHEENDTFAVIRFRSPGNLTNKITFSDAIRGEISMIDNYNDIVILKGDGLPTYHLAHIVDDTLMRTSHVMRGEERLTSVPLHLQLFKAFDLTPPIYAHLAPICKLDQGKKRKLSKRHDPEANVAFFFEKGYSTQGLIEYIMTLADSNFEDRRKDHSEEDLNKFHFDLAKISTSWPLFDQQKLNRINNSYLSKIPTEELYQQVLERATTYQPEYAKLLIEQPDYAKSAINIERFTEKDPKRYTTYADVMHQTLLFFDAPFAEENAEHTQRENFASISQIEIYQQHTEAVNAFLDDYLEQFNLETDTLTRFEQLKKIWQAHGFAPNNAEFKTGNYKGKAGDLAMILRILLLKAKQTPDLFSVMKVMGKERVKQRILAWK